MKESLLKFLVVTVCLVGLLVTYSSAQDVSQINSEMQVEEILSTMEVANEKLVASSTNVPASDILGATLSRELAEATSIASIRLYNEQNSQNTIDPVVAWSLSTGQVRIREPADDGAPFLIGPGHKATPILQPQFDGSGTRVIGLTVTDFESLSPDELKRAIAEIKEKCGQSSSCVPNPDPGGAPPKEPRPACPPVCGGNIPCPKGCKS